MTRPVPARTWFGSLLVVVSQTATFAGPSPFTPWNTPDRAKAPVGHRPGPVGWLSVAAGAAMLILPIVLSSPYLAAPVFLGFAFFLDPLNAWMGASRSSATCARDITAG